MMKKFILLTSYALPVLCFSQHSFCDFDRTLTEDGAGTKNLRESFDLILGKLHDHKAGESSGSKNTNTVTFEIPVVIHIITPAGAPPGSSYNPSDLQIQNWISRANQMYEGSYPWPNAAPDFNSSAALPVKLVLARRDPNCNSTTGIIRYNGGNLAGYDSYGVMRYSNSGVYEGDIKTLAAHWPESSYFNIYIVNMFDGDNSTGGLMGWAGFPTNPNIKYDSFIKAAAVTNTDDITLAHEFGHAMGLYHTFNGGNPAAAPGSSDYCPPSTGTCSKDDDKVCDTERSGSAYQLYPAPANTQINPCTGNNYQGVQYNMMNYSNSSAKKFTAGQGERIHDSFLVIRGSLVSSGAGNVPPSSAPVNTAPIAASCVPPGVNAVSSMYYSSFVGPVYVKLGQISNYSAPAYSEYPEYYIDYTLKPCFSNFHTTLNINQSHIVEVGFIKTSTGDQSVKVWIDYNNNGIFEMPELVASANAIQASAGGYGYLSASFTPPVNAVMNQPLRMRVISDLSTLGGISPCGQLSYGQAEDYAVTFVSSPSLSLQESRIKAGDLSIYPNPVSKDENVHIRISGMNRVKVSVYEASGRWLENPEPLQQDQEVFIFRHHLSRGSYVITATDGIQTRSGKLIVR